MKLLDLLSDKMNVDKTEAWKVVSDKSVDDLRKSVRKQKKNVLKLLIQCLVRMMMLQIN